MRRLDRLVIGELIGPWVFGVGIFTVLIMAGTYLFKITDFIVQGVPASLIIQLTYLVLPGIMVKTFAMAVLLASLLAFGRLSSDSEIVAMRAAGASVARIMVPVGLFGLIVALIAFAINEKVVPAAALRGTAIQTEISKKLNSSSWKPVFTPVNDPSDGKLVALVVAKDFNLIQRTLKSAWILTFTKAGDPSFMLYAPEFQYTDSKEWRIKGGSKLLSYDGSVVMKIQGDTWPAEVPKVSIKPEDLLAGNLKDLDAYSMSQMKEQIKKAKLNPQAIGSSQIVNLEYGYYNKIALPLAAFVFGLVGAPLGIRNHRTGAAAGFWISIVIIFSYLTLANWMAVSAQGGIFPAWVASFSPIAIGLVVAGVLIHRRNL